MNELWVRDCGKKKHSWNWLIEGSCDLSTNNSIEQLELGKEMFLHMEDFEIFFCFNLGQKKCKLERERKFRQGPSSICLD